MALERTLSILKPDCIRKGLAGAVLGHIEKAGFKIAAIRMIHLAESTAGMFYDVHRGKPFFEELVKFMSSGPCMPMVLEKENAMAALRELMGATDPTEAEDGTIRKLYADSKGENIIHGSDSTENAAIEIAYFFPKMELVQNDPGNAS